MKTYFQWMILLITTSQLINGQSCPTNEEFVECVDSCNLCERTEQPCTYIFCFAGCDCVPGYRRNLFGSCVPEVLCSDSSPVISGINDDYTFSLDDKCTDSSSCKRACIQQGFAGGYCRDQACQCIEKHNSISPNPPQSFPFEPRSSNRTKPGGCPDLATPCNANCLATGFSSGKCIGITCKCEGKIEPSTTAVPTKPSELAEDANGGCPNVTLCNDRCRQAGNSSGACVENKCQCIGEGSMPEELEDQPPIVTSGGCPDNAQCRSMCLRRGLGEGSCIGPFRSVCRCGTFPLSPPPPPRPNLRPPPRPILRPPPRPILRPPPRPILRPPPIPNIPPPPPYSGRSAPALPEELEDQPPIATSGGCPNNRQCNKMCVQRGLGGGSCIGPSRSLCRCGVSALPPPPPPPIPNLPPPPYNNDLSRFPIPPPPIRRPPAKRCIDSACSRICQNRGFRSGSCKYPGDCRCFY